MRANIPALPEIPCQVFSQFLWYGKYIKIEDNPIHFANFSNMNINFLLQLFEILQAQIRGHLEGAYKLTNYIFHYWAQLKHATSTRWKKLTTKFIGVN